MILIEKSYYSTESGEITIIIKDSEPSEVGIFSAVQSLKLSKANSGSEDYYTVTISKYVETDEGSALVIFIDPSSDLTKDDVESPNFSIDGITCIDATIDDVELRSYIYNPDEFYSYRVEMLTRYNSYDYSKVEKDIIRFSFLESALINALDSGYIEDAAMFYNELYKVYLTYRNIYY